MSGENQCKVCGQKLPTGSRTCRRLRCRRSLAWDYAESEDRIRLANEAGVGMHFIRKNMLPSRLSFAVPLAIPAARSAYFCGPVGTGKTWGLCCIVCDSLADGLTARMVNWAWLQAEIRSTYQPAARETEFGLLRRYAEVDVLCVDDLGCGKEVDGRESEAARVLLYTLLDKRYAEARRTCLSGNLPPDQLDTRYDARIARRIREMCQVVVLKDQL
jgi:DNA replication protein DnaC